MGENYSISGHWAEEFTEAGFRKWIEKLRSGLGDHPVSLALVFMSPPFFSRASQILELVRLHGQAPMLAGCSSQGLIAEGREIEENAGISVGLYHLPGATLEGVYFEQSQLEEVESPDYWRKTTGVAPEETNGWLAFVDPFTMDSERWLKSWNESYKSVPVVGGLASSGMQEESTRVFLNGEVYEQGGVAISIGGNVKLESVTSQGCTPIGETWTLTKVEDNVIYTIGNRAAYEVLAETFASLTPDEQRKARGNLFLGLVVNEYREDFHRGDFLIRNLMGANPESGALVVGALPRTGQTVQFQRRSAVAANEDLYELLDRLKRRLGGVPVYGGCLCACNGRGRGLFGRADHDAGLVQNTLGPLGLTGFFCNGEIGPVGNKNFLHGYTASLAVFVPASEAK